MGYAGKIQEQARARELRARGWTLQAIAEHLQVSKSSLSLWVRDVNFAPHLRPNQNAQARNRPPSTLARRKQDEIAWQHALAHEQVGQLSHRDLLIAGIALYAGEGAKTDGKIAFANTNPEIVRLFCTWLRTMFTVDEERLRVRLYLHEDLDLAAATTHWSDVTGIPATQFGQPYRAVAHETMRLRRHEFGCATVIYNCARTHRRVMGLVEALLGGCGTRQGQRLSFISHFPG